MAKEIEGGKNILIHSIVFPPDGVSTAYLYGDIAEKLVQEGCKVTVLTSTPHYNPPQGDFKMIKRVGGLFYKSSYKGIPVFHIPQKKPQSTFSRIFQFLKFHILGLGIGAFLPKFDLILSPSPPLTLGFVSVLLAKMRGAKAIYNVQEIYPDLAIEDGTLGNPVIIKLLKKLEKFVYNNCAKVITIDPFLVM